MMLALGVTYDDGALTKVQLFLLDIYLFMVPWFINMSAHIMSLSVLII